MVYLGALLHQRAKSPAEVRILNRKAACHVRAGQMFPLRSLPTLKVRDMLMHACCDFCNFFCGKLFKPVTHITAKKIHD